MHQIAFQSEYYFGDLVEYTSYSEGPFCGRITNITLSDDGAVHYAILCDDETAHFGVYPDEMKLVEKGPNKQSG